MSETRSGWTCPGCGRGVAPDQKTCDHGLAFSPRHEVVWPLDVPWRAGYGGCACPPTTVCANTACPRLLRVGAISNSYAGDLR